MLAAPLNATIQAAVAPQSILGRCSLRPPPARRRTNKQTQALRTRIGLTFAQGTSSAQATAGTPERPFYNRFNEENGFKEQWSDEPGVITVLVGPPNCGKTRFLQELADQLEADETAPPFLYIDSRVTPVRTPEEVSKALLNVLAVEKIEKIKNYMGRGRFESLVSSLKITGRWKWKWLSWIPGFSGSLEMEVVKDLKKDAGNLPLAIEKYQTILEALKPLPRKPVLVIDEANILMEWKEPDSSQPQLQELLAFLIAISKQNNLAHVILATSDYFLATWLSQQGLTSGKFKVEVLGDLTEEEAREFVLGDGAIGEWHGIIKYSSSPVPVPSGAEEQWPAIYARCSGNIGLLKQCVAAARVQKNWESALREVEAGALEDVRRGLEPEVYIKKGGESPLWTKDQWKRVLECITTAPHHAVSVSKMKNELENAGEGKGSDILLSMLKYNLLALRPFSALARDLPREVYGDAMETVVTLRLPAHVWAAKVVLKSLEDRGAESSDRQA